MMNRLGNNLHRILIAGRQCQSLNHHAYSALCINQCNFFKENTQNKTLNYFSKFNKLNTKAVSVDASSDGFFKSFIKRVGWLPHVKTKIRLRGYMLYENVADKLNYEYFIKENNLENTFSSWFIITELHVWMLLVRCMADGDEGRLLRNAIVEAMWADVTVRAKKLTPSSSLARKQVDVLSEEFQAALVSYDEGLMSNDMVLAGAIWRRFFGMQCDDPLLIENIIRYTRKQILLLEKTALTDNPKINWIDFKEKK